VLLSRATDLDGHNYHHDAWASLPNQFPGHTFIITRAGGVLTRTCGSPNDGGCKAGGTW